MNKKETISEKTAPDYNYMCEVLYLLSFSTRSRVKRFSFFPPPSWTFKGPHRLLTQMT